MADPRLCLAAMPFASLQYPSLALALLAGRAREAGVATSELYFSFDFAEACGIGNYLFLSDEAHYQALLGEWIFSASVFPPDDGRAMGYLTQVLSRHVEPVAWLALMAEALAARKRAPGFVEACADQVAAEAPDVVGITSSFQQVMSSVALARAVRDRLPGACIVLGGANCEGVLGRNLLRAFPQVDAVCTGEGDEAFPEFLAAWRPGEALPAVPGMLTRQQAQEPDDPAERPRLVQDLDSLPVPDFTAFYRQFRRTPGLAETMSPVPTIETSRGCWWGAKHHCTFCGLNGRAMSFRSKSAPRAHAEFAAQADRYGTDFVVVDNILDFRYFDDLLPMLAADERPFVMHYEVKANLSAKAILGLARAGVRKIQPGIETLDSTILRLMRKGTTALQNIQTLKLCAEAGIFVDWGFIHGFPGEEEAAYRGVERLVPLLHHLQPPAAIGPVRADRFSPYFATPEAFGIGLRPAEPYFHVFPWAEQDVAGLAYHFDIVQERPEELRRATEAATSAMRRWQELGGRSTLHLAEDPDGPDGPRVIDGRAGRERVHRLDAPEHALLRRAAAIVGRDRLAAALTQAFGAGAFDRALGRLTDLGLVVGEDDALLALPLRTPGFTAAPRWEAIRAGREPAFASLRAQEFCTPA